MEANKYVPSTVLALKIARVFDKKVEDLFILEDGD
jgi:putative transcriptional regulator